MRPKPGLLVVVFCLLAPGGLLAHPHMAITSCSRFVWKGDRLSGVYLDWGFDPYFSADIIGGYDRNRDGAFDAKETEAVYREAFSNLKNYSYFTFIRQGDVRTNPETVSDFSAYQKGGTLHYRFFVDLSQYAGDLCIAVYDYTYFCAFDYPQENPVELDCDRSIVSPTAEIVENRKYPVYYDPLGPATDTTIHYVWKKGLLTFYPREIHVSYAPARQ